MNTKPTRMPGVLPRGSHDPPYTLSSPFRRKGELEGDDPIPAHDRSMNSTVIVTSSTNSLLPSLFGIGPVHFEGQARRKV